uniref:hypothetical protein n=1 Tax=Lithothamnion corallioides TaxID=1277934 RepID=UPI0023F2BCFE|nr:hypothetical protein P6G75_pgp198 [Lithothamnion corallioides]WEA76997.1 hypothetical protein [Lithothamnion corallioides]
MDKELSRNLHILVWQYIDWKVLIQYVDNLKSRIYKASIQKSYEKIYDSQLSLINSPLVKLVAFKQIFDLYYHRINLNSFQLGYLVSYFSLESTLDYSVLVYYSSDRILNSNRKIQLIIDKVKNLVMIWSIEPYQNYLYYLNSFSISSYYNKYTNFNIRNEIYSYRINVSLISLFYYLDLSIFINRMYLLNSIKEYIYKFLNKGVFIALINSLDNYIKLSVLRKQKIGLFNKLIDIFILNICYEMDILLRSYTNFQLSVSKNIIIIKCASDLLVICEDCSKLKLWLQVFLDILLSNGVEIKEKKYIKKIPLFQDIDLRTYLITINLWYPLKIIAKPSLYYQFILLKQVATIITKSKSLFLLIIRLNMLLLSWSTLYRNRQISKLFSLLDYLIYLKIKSFIVNRHSNWSNQRIKLKYFPQRIYSFNAIEAQTNWSFSTNIISSSYYKLYFSIKLSWLIR